MTALASLRPALPGPGHRWARLSLATRFALAAGAVLLPAALAIAAFVADRIEDAVVRSAAQATALYVDSVISPSTQDFAANGAFSPQALAALEQTFATAPLGERVVSFKFWDTDGRILWAQNKDLVGQAFPLSDDLRRALAGEVVGSFDDLHDEENEDEAALGLPLLEIYSPIREMWSGRVVAVAEFYELAPVLARDLRAARLEAWGAVAALVLGLGSILWAIVLGGSRTIEKQGRDLDARLRELRDLSARNQELRLRVQAAAARAAAQADRTLRTLGADLHDGPAQHLAYAALRLDALRGRLDGHPVAPDLSRIEAAVQDAMNEMRQISRGLQLPDIAGRPLLAILRDAAEVHQARTGHEVALRTDCASEPPLAPGARVCVYRFLQEGLGNASRHAGGQGLEVELACTGHELRLAVRDRGPGLPPTLREGAMGLSGLRDRVEALGGTFLARPRPGGGAEIAMTLETGPSA